MNILSLSEATRPKLSLLLTKRRVLRWTAIGVGQLTNSLSRIVPLLYAGAWLEESQFGVFVVIFVAYELLMTYLRTVLAESALLKEELAIGNSLASELVWLSLTAGLPISIGSYWVASLLSGVPLGIDFYVVAPLTLFMLTVDVVRVVSVSGSSSGETAGRDILWFGLMTIFLVGFRPESAKNLFVILALTSIPSFVLLLYQERCRINVRAAYSGLWNRGSVGWVLTGEVTAGLFLSRVALLLVGRASSPSILAEIRLVLSIFGPLNLFSTAAFWLFARNSATYMKDALVPISAVLTAGFAAFTFIGAGIFGLDLIPIEVNPLVLLFVGLSLTISAPTFALRTYLYRTTPGWCVLVPRVAAGLVSLVVVPFAASEAGATGTAHGLVLVSLVGLVAWMLSYRQQENRKLIALERPAL